MAFRDLEVDVTEQTLFAEWLDQDGSSFEVNWFFERGDLAAHEMGFESDGFRVTGGRQGYVQVDRDHHPVPPLHPWSRFQQRIIIEPHRVRVSATGWMAKGAGKARPLDDPFPMVYGNGHRFGGDYGHGRGHGKGYEGGRGIGHGGGKGRGRGKGDEGGKGNNVNWQPVKIVEGDLQPEPQPVNDNEAVWRPEALLEDVASDIDWFASDMD